MSKNVFMLFIKKWCIFLGLKYVPKIWHTFFYWFPYCMWYVSVCGHIYTYIWYDVIFITKYSGYSKHSSTPFHSLLHYVAPLHFTAWLWLYISKICIKYFYFPKICLDAWFCCFIFFFCFDYHSASVIKFHVTP